MLNESSIDKNPFHQFEKWYGEAYKVSGEDASAMTLATSLKNHPNARTVYLRGQDKKGYWFFTNYKSSKGKELIKNKNACLLFFWPRLLRQVKMLGYVEKLSAKESDNYFDARPRASQIGAWASPQSQLLPSRSSLDAWVEEYTKLFEGKKVKRPSHWGGFRFIPVYFEFWHGRESRLHDRIIFRKEKNGKWKMQRLSP
ncbi:MAG: pyridoxamine 5'-phosphate oxidase [Bacteroidetes bacterium]|nr:pyridoxamine 5'-phosphate oxidase [Bacteroidota bacterium]